MGFELTTLVVIGTDCIGSCKSNYHTMTTTMAPIVKIDFKLWLLTVPPISTKWNTTSHLNSLNIKKRKKTTTYDRWNAVPSLRQAHKCGWLNQLMGYQPSLLINWISKSNANTYTYSLLLKKTHSSTKINDNINMDSTLLSLAHS